MAAVRSSQSKTGLSIVTDVGDEQPTTLPESHPQNIVPFGANNTAGNSGSLLAAPGAGKCWIITELTVIAGAGSGEGVQINFTGNLTVTFGGPPCSAQNLLTTPVAIPVNTSFGYSSQNIYPGNPACSFTVSGSAYKSTIADATIPDQLNPLPAQVVKLPIDSIPTGNLG